MAYCILNLALDTPLNSCFDYRWPCEPGAEPQVGQLAMVNFGHREVVGLIVEVRHETDVPADKLKDALAVHGAVRFGQVDPDEYSRLPRCGQQWQLLFEWP